MFVFNAPASLSNATAAILWAGRDGERKICARGSTRRPGSRSPTERSNKLAITAGEAARSFLGLASYLGSESAANYVHARGSSLGALPSARRAGETSEETERRERDESRFNRLLIVRIKCPKKCRTVRMRLNETLRAHVRDLSGNTVCLANSSLTETARIEMREKKIYPKLIY